MKKIILIFLCFTATVLNLSANPVAGSTCFLQHLNTNIYKLRVEMIVECGSAPAPASLQIMCNYGGAMVVSMPKILPKISATYYPTPDTTIITNCTNITSLIPGYEKVIYEDTLSANYGALFGWQFQQCTRSTFINLSPNECSSNGMINWPTSTSTLSPTFLNNNVIYTNTQANNIYNINSIDADGDSIDFSFVKPADSTFKNYYTMDYKPNTYSSGYSLSNPFGVGSSIAINQITGKITYTSANAGAYIVSVLVKEYSGSQLISSTIRDLVFVVVPTLPNSVNDLSNNSISIFPNPCNDNIELQGVLINDEVKIINTLGNQVYYEKINSKRETKINISNLSNGIYSILIIRNGKVKVLKTLKTN